MERFNFKVYHNGEFLPERYEATKVSDEKYNIMWINLKTKKAHVVEYDVEAVLFNIKHGAWVVVA